MSEVVHNIAILIAVLLTLGAFYAIVRVASPPDDYEGPGHP